VIKVYSPPPKEKGEIIEGDPKETVKKLMDLLIKDKVI
jgi:hypothetical protein